MVDGETVTRIVFGGGVWKMVAEPVAFVAASVATTVQGPGAVEAV
jgi:hypothetical protein